MRVTEGDCEVRPQSGPDGRHVGGEVGGVEVGLAGDAAGSISSWGEVGAAELHAHDSSFFEIEGDREPALDASS